jgi:hypothetical protein
MVMGSGNTTVAALDLGERYQRYEAADDRDRADFTAFRANADVQGAAIE